MYHIEHILIQNFRAVEYEKIPFGKNKTVFVGKNNSGKTSCLKAIEKLLNSKKIKKRDFHNPKKTLILNAKIKSQDDHFHLKLEAYYDTNGNIIVKNNFSEAKQKIFLEKLNLIYIPSDRRINSENKENGYIKLIDLILKVKEEWLKEITKQAHKKLFSMDNKTGRKKTTLLVSLLKLYMYSIRKNNRDFFNVFIIDQPENFLHPHATRVIDQILQQIWEFENTKVFYATHSPELVSNFKKWKYEISDIVFVKNTDGTAHTKIIKNTDGKYDRIMISLIFKNAYLFFSDAIILVEWETEKISIPNIFENTNLLPYCWEDCKYLSPEQRENYFNLSAKNISVVDVGGKWALYDWFEFCTELFWKENVVAIIDRDENFSIDRDMIQKSIRSIYKVKKIYENDFPKYNWIVLDWEFESYYKIEVIRGFIQDTLYRRAQAYGKNFSPEKYRQTLEKLDEKLEKLKDAKKISSVYEHIFNSYFRKYSKPTIAFNLSTWLCQNDGYDEALLQMLSDIVKKFDH